MYYKYVQICITQMKWKTHCSSFGWLTEKLCLNRNNAKKYGIRKNWLLLKKIHGKNQQLQ